MTAISGDAGADLERMAREAWDADPRDIFPTGWADYVPIVRAILQELREPSEGMLESVDLWAGSHAKVRGDFQAMIDHILAEP